MLFDAGAIDRMGRVDAGTATTDFDPDETRRHMSVNLAVAPCEWREHKINFIDTPGYSDFLGEVESGMRVADAAVLVIAASAGVEVGTETAWEIAGNHNLPRFIFVNKLDRENADFPRALESIQTSFGKRCVALQMPVGSESAFSGVVDILHQVAFTGTGKAVQQGAVPAELESQVAAYRDAL